MTTPRGTWLKLDNGFPEHPKVLGITDASFRVCIEAMCYAHRNMTDGVIPGTWVHRPKVAGELVTRGLWVPAPEGDAYLIHDYLMWQTPRARIDDIRKARSEAGRRGAAARWNGDGE